jgi:predicted nucleic acid-binding protein
MSDKCFIDTNILIYVYSGDDLQKRSVATELFNENAPPLVSVHVLNEFSNVLLKKGLSCTEALSAVNELCEFSQVCQTSSKTTKEALRIAEKYRYRFYDSFHLATALENSCVRFFSEDLQHTQRIQGMSIINPFE